MHKLLKNTQHSIAAAEQNTRQSKQKLSTVHNKIQETQISLNKIESDKKRIADTAESLYAASTDLQATSARLTFERARLNRSYKNMKKSLSGLRDAQDNLQARAQDSQRVLEFAANSQELIEAIEVAMREGKPIGSLLKAGETLTAKSKKTGN